MIKLWWLGRILPIESFLHSPSRWMSLSQISIYFNGSIAYYIILVNILYVLHPGGTYHHSLYWNYLYDFTFFSLLSRKYLSVKICLFLNFWICTRGSTIFQVKISERDEISSLNYSIFDKLEKWYRLRYWRSCTKYSF